LDVPSPSDVPGPLDVPTPLDAAVVRFLRTGDLTPFRRRPRRGNAPSSPERR
jgi:hypothetical protein